MNNKKNYKVYIYTNKINNKSYVGQTCRSSLSVRAGYKGERYYHSTKFWAAIQKYGWDSFEGKILIDNLTLEEANEKEKQFIEFYDTINNGYNIFPGGHNQTTSESTKEKQRIARLKKIEENKQKYGCGLDPSAKEKLKEYYQTHPMPISNTFEMRQKVSNTLKEKCKEKIFCEYCGKEISKIRYGVHLKYCPIYNKDKEKS